MKKWTDKEIEILKENYKIEFKEQVYEMISNRTKSAIQHKASRLKLTISQNTGATIQRFWHLVDRKEKNECWYWTGCYDNYNYGIIKIDKKTVKAHRLSWQIHFGKISNNLLVCHSCDHPLCVNPNHLFLGTHQDNSDDKINKNRQSRVCGENHGMAKLTLEKVKAIKILLSQDKMSQREISRIFNISYQTISSIHRNKTWKS